MNRILKCLLLPALLSNLAIAQAEQPESPDAPGAQSAAKPATPPNPDEPDRLAEQAIEANRKIESVRKNIRALDYAADGAVMWPDPVLAVEYSNVPVDSLVLGEHPMSGVQFKLQQAFPFPGKNSRREEVARGTVRETEWMLAEQKVQLAARVKSAYWNLALVRRLRRVTEKHVGLINQLIDSVNAKYRTGQAGQHDLLRLKVLRDQLKDDLLDFDQKERELVSAINSVLHREIGTEILTPDKFPEAELSLSFDQLLKRAIEDRPLLKYWEEYSKTRRLAGNLSDYERWPDISLWAGYRLREAVGVDMGVDQVSAGIAIPLPFDYSGRLGAKSQQQYILAESGEDSYQALVDDISSELQRAISIFERTTAKIKNYESGLTPDAEKTLTAARAAYQTGRAEFETLYSAGLQLLQFERTTLNSKTTRLVMKTNIEAIIGGPISKVGGGNENE